MSNASLATSPAADHPNLSPHVQQALDMLELDPDQELERYRQYKSGELQATVRSGADELNEENPRSTSNLLVNMTEDEDEDDDEDEEYEIIPPSESFAVYQEENARSSPAGEMVLTGEIQTDASLDLSFAPPGEMTSARDEYLPASQELWRSLGQPQALSGEQPLPKWKMPVAIGSALVAIAAVGGMSYVNLHPTLLKGVPWVAQLTAPAVLPVIPPGQALSGPDLAMGEFSELTLSNINGITLPNGDAKISAAPTSSSATISPAVPQAAPANPAIVPTSPALTLAPTAPPARLADGLIRNLLPLNIQQLAGQQQAPVNNVQPTQPIQPPFKPYTPKQFYYQPPAGAIGQPRYAVMTKYVNPLGFAKIQSLIPGATVKGDEIDLGSFARKSAALATVEKLQQEGVKAWIAKQP